MGNVNEGEKRACGSLWKIGPENQEEGSPPAAPKKKKGPAEDKSGQSSTAPEEEIEEVPHVTRVNPKTGSARSEGEKPTAFGSPRLASPSGSPNAFPPQHMNGSPVFTRPTSFALKKGPFDKDQQNWVREILTLELKGNYKHDLIGKMDEEGVQKSGLITFVSSHKLGDPAQVKLWAAELFDATVRAQEEKTKKKQIYSSAGPMADWADLWAQMVPPNTAVETVVRDSVENKDDDCVRFVRVFLAAALREMHAAYNEKQRATRAEQALAEWQLEQEAFMAVYKMYAIAAEDGSQEFTMESYANLCKVWAVCQKLPSSEADIELAAAGWLRVFPKELGDRLTLDQFRTHFFGLNLTKPGPQWAVLDEKEAAAKLADWCTPRPEHDTEVPYEKFPAAVEHSWYQPPSTSGFPSAYRAFGPIRPWHPAASTDAMRITQALRRGARSSLQ